MKLSLFALFLGFAALAAAPNQPPRPQPAQPSCPASEWHLVSGPSLESCRSIGECPMSCRHFGSRFCYEPRSKDFCGEHELGQEYLCYCPNDEE